MADSNVLGVVCEPRGRRGRRGRTGHDGHDGHDGHPGSTGPTGPTGPAGASGLSAYGYAVGIEDATVGPNQDARFSSGGLDFPHVGLTVPIPNGTAFTILSEGDYEYNFYVVGNATSDTIEFGMFVDGVSAGAAHEFRSDTEPDPNNARVVRGQGIFQLDAGAVVTLRNRTGSGTRQVRLAAFAPGAETTANVTLSLKKLS